MPQLVKLSSSKKHHFVAILHEKDTVESMLMRDFCFSVLIHQQLWAIITIVGKLTQNEFTTNSLVIIWNWHCAKPCREWEENLFKCWKFARKWQIVHVWAGHCRDFVKRKFEKKRVLIIFISFCDWHLNFDLTKCWYSTCWLPEPKVELSFPDRN